MVALGDSQTYGTGVGRGAAWPARLSGLIGEPVYNMGLGGYGATHANENLATALSLEPELVVFALYFGNDFYDDYRFAMSNGLLRDFVSERDLRSIELLEEQEPIKEKAAALFDMGRGNEEAEKDPAVAGNAIPARLREFLARKSRLYGLAWNVARRLYGQGRANPLFGRDFTRAKESIGPRQADFVSVFDDRNWRTVLTSPYRLLAIDDGDPRIHAGYEISRHTVAAMRDRVAEAGARFVVLLVPTKETVFWARINDPGSHIGLRALVEKEEELRRNLMAFLQARGIDFIDPIPALRRSEAQPYFPDADGHPNAVGHAIIAEEVRMYINGIGDFVGRRIL